MDSTTKQTPKNYVRRAFVWLLAGAEARLGLRVFRVRVRELVATLPLSPLPPEWRVEQLPSEQWRALVNDPGLCLEPSDITDFQSATMTAVLHRDRVVAYAFAAVGGARIDEHVCASCDLPYRYSFKSYTRPEYRGRRLSAYTSLHSDPLFLARGCTHAISYASCYNLASIRTEASKGNRYAGFAGYIVLGGWTITFHSPGAKKIGFRLASAARQESNAPQTAH